MRTGSAAVGTFAWLVAAPGTVSGLVPWLITGWRRPDDTVLLLEAVGAVICLVGSSVLLRAFLAFAREGHGTPAPVAPTERLVVSGAYRHVRNPMYLAIFAVVLGQALLFLNWGLVAYLVILIVVSDAFVRSYEEPTLQQTYGGDYEEFRSTVPRWIPQLARHRIASRTTS